MPREVCQQVESEECEQVEREQCSQVPSQQCVTVQDRKCKGRFRYKIKHELSSHYDPEISQPN